MENRDWTYVDKSSWPRGDWDGEPDKKQWTDPETGLPCLIVRGPAGALCGYVGVSKGHPAFEKDYNDVDVECHGGLTFADHCSPHRDDPEKGICHVVQPGDDDNVWWLGFDCAHSWDVCPSYKPFDWQATYKSLGYVMRQVEKLASQLKAMA